MKKQQWTDDERVVARAADAAGLQLVKALCGDEIAYSLFDRQREKFLQPNVPMTLREALDECLARR